MLKNLAVVVLLLSAALFSGCGQNTVNTVPPQESTTNSVQ